MAYVDAAFQKIGGNYHQNLWAYHSADAIATVYAANYFDTQIAAMNIGDVILAACVVGGTEVFQLLVVVGVTTHVTVVTNVTQS
jgi:hypothetical protein